MSHPLAGVIEKLRRSDEHLILLYHEISAYLESTPYGLLPDRDPYTRQAVVRFKVTKEPPLRLSTIVGDALFNMRASLDYIVHELVIRNGCGPTFQTQFPFADSEKTFLGEAYGKGRLWGTSIKMLNVIDALQPYKIGTNFRSHPLWVLHKLQNIDKHRTLTLSAFVGARTRWMFMSNTLPLKCHTVSSDTVIHDGDVVVKLPFGFKPDAKVQGRITGQVSFQDSVAKDLEIGIGLQVIREMIGQKVVPAIEPFFDPLPDDLRLTSHGVPAELIKQIKPIPEVPILKS
jgi:hypothetical protein